MPEETRTNRSLERHTGSDGLLKFDTGDGFKRFPISNVSWTRDIGTNEVQHDGSLKPTLTTTDIRYSGSFEYSGQNPDALLSVNQTEEGGSIEQDRPVRGTLTIKEYNHDANGQTVQTVSFKRVLVTSTNRELPADGSSSTSFDFNAEDMIITDNR